MTFGPKTELGKRNTLTSKKFDNNVVSENCDVIVFFPIYGQFAAIRDLDSGRMIFQTFTFSLIISFYLTKTENRTKKSLT